MHLSKTLKYMIKSITSPQNPLIKQLNQLKDKSRQRKKTGQFLIEGKRELSLAIKGGYKIETLLFFPDLFSESEAKAMSQYGIDIIEISKEVFQKLAHRDTTEGVIAVVNSKAHQLEDLKLTNKNPLILVTEAPEKPEIQQKLKMLTNYTHGTKGWGSRGLGPTHVCAKAFRRVFF